MALAAGAAARWSSRVTGRGAGAMIGGLVAMKNPADVGLITTEEGRQKYADAVVRGIAGFLASQQRAG